MTLRDGPVTKAEIDRFMFAICAAFMESAGQGDSTDADTTWGRAATASVHAALTDFLARRKAANND